jgi:hypothetical protein
LAAWIKAAIKSGSANLISRSAERANQIEAMSYADGGPREESWWTTVSGVGSTLGIIESRAMRPGNGIAVACEGLAVTECAKWHTRQCWSSYD